MEQELRVRIKIDSQSSELGTINAGFNKLENSTQRTNNSTKQLKESTNALSSAYSTLKGIIASTLAIGIFREYAKTSDAMSLLESRIKLVAREGDNYATTQKELIRVAYENRVAYGSVGELYARLSPAMRSLNADTSTVIGVTDAFSKSLLVSGASTAEAAGSARQFSQAMASGVLRGDEFNSMMENSPRAGQALQETLGKTQGELRKMAENGELVSKIVAGALLMNLAKLREEAEKMPNTISGEFIRLQNQISITVDELNKATGASEEVVKVIKSIEDVLSNASSIDSTQIKQYAGYVLDLGEAYVAYKASVVTASLATVGINLLMETSSKITTAKTAATVAETEAERLGLIAAQNRIAADTMKRDGAIGNILATKANIAILEKEAISSATAAKHATLHSYELQSVASKAGVASMAIGGLTTAFKTFAPTAVLFGITEIFLNWDKITGNVKNNLITASDQLEKMTNNQLDVQATNLKKVIQDINKELSIDEGMTNNPNFNDSSLIMSDGQLTQAKAQIDTLRQEKDKFEKILNEIDELRKKNTSNKVSDLDAFTKAERAFSAEVNKSDLAKVQYEIRKKMLDEGKAEADEIKRIKGSTATINTQISALEKQYSIQKEIKNLDVESALIAEKITKPEAEYLKEVNDIKSQIAKNQQTINLLNATEYDKKNDANWEIDQVKNLEKVNELKKANELLTIQETAAEQKKASTIKTANDELLTSISSLNISDTDKQYQDLAKNISNLIKEGRDLKLVGEYATIVADQISREDAYSHLQTELDIRTQIAEVSLYGTEKETAAEQIRHDGVIANLGRELDTKKLNASEYAKLLVIENQRNKQNSDSLFKFMMDGFDNVNKAMDENFFNALTGKFKKWGDWFDDFMSTLGTSAVQGLSRTLAGGITNSLQSNFVNAYRTYGGLSASSSLVGTTLSASDISAIMTSGGTFDSGTNTIKTTAGTAIKLAGDGSGIVTNSGSDLTNGLNVFSGIKTAYGVLTDGISGSIMSGFNGISDVLASGGFWEASAGVSNFGYGVANPFTYGAGSGAFTSTTIGAGLSSGLIGGIAGYGIGSLGDKIFGADTYAGTAGAIGGALGGIGSSLGLWGGPIGIIAGSLIGSVLGGLFGKTKVTGKGIDIYGTASAENADGRYYTGYQKKSWFSSKKWETYQGFSSEEIEAIQTTIGAYDYLLSKLGEYNDLVVAGGRFSSLQSFLDTNVVKAFLVEINPNELDAIYQSWVDYAAKIDSTITEAIASAVSGYVTYGRGYTEWDLGKGTVEQLAFTANYLKTDFEELAESLGAGSVNADNFLSMYDTAIKNNFTQETIEKWASLGDALMKSTDAAKEYQDALDSLNTSTTLSLPTDMLLQNLTVSSNTVDFEELIKAQATGNSKTDKMVTYLYEILKLQRDLIRITKFGTNQGIPA